MELRDYIMKFPLYWRGIFAPLSKNSQPVLGADSWLLENREGALTCRSFGQSSSRGNQADWGRFIEGLYEKEPEEVEGRLVFLPRILLFPVNIQRNTLAFLCQHTAEIPTRGLEKLLDSLKNRPLPDEWTRLHLRTLQDFVCKKQCRDYGSGHRPDSHRLNLTQESRTIFENICQQINNKDANRAASNEGYTLQFDWLSEALSTNPRTCQHSAYFAADFGSLETRVSPRNDRMLTSKEEDSAKAIGGRINLQQSGPESPEIIEICYMSLPTPMEVATITAGKSPDQISEQSRIQSEEKLRENKKAIGDGEENRDDAIDAVTMDNLTSLKTALYNPAGGIISPELLEVIIYCPIDKVEAFCDVLELDSALAAGLGALVQQLSNFSLELSHSSAATLAGRCFGKQVQDLTQTAPRTLLSAIVCLAKAFPKPTVDGALLPALAREGCAIAATSHQCDLVTKVIKEALTNESRVYLLSKVLSVQTLQWSEEMTGLFQTTLACKLELDNPTLEMFVVALEHHGSSQNSCNKFAKLLLTVINRFSKQISATSRSALQRLADANQTFLKKNLLAAIKRVKG